LSELEVRRHDKTAVTTLEWAIEILSRQDVGTLFVELALLVEYLKMSALHDACEEADYLIVKQTIPLVFEYYDPCF
jgi:hypothetical protein